MNQSLNDVERCIQQLRSTEVGSDEWLQLVARLQALGPEAVPALLQKFSDDTFAVSTGICKALAGIGIEGIDYLLDSLGTGNDTSRYGAARILSGLSWRQAADMTHTIPTLRQALTDLEPEVRRFAAIALCGMKDLATPAVPELISALKDDEWGVREWAAKALDAIAPKEALGPLTELLLDEVPPVRDAASEALESIKLRHKDN